MSRGAGAGRPLALAVAIGVAAACQGGGPKAPPKTPRATVDRGPAFESPARWMSFPREVGSATATLELPDGGCLVTTEDGQRWEIARAASGGSAGQGTATPASPCSGPARASGSPTLEALVGAQKTPDGFRFIGDGGTVYEAREPLGPFTKIVRPPSPLRRVASQGAVVVGIDEGGAAFRYDGAWTKAEVPGAARPIDVGVDAAGRVLLLTAPESILLSSDGGKSFAPAGAALGPVGAHEIVRDAAGALGVRGVAKNLRWQDDRLVPTTAPLDGAPPAQVALTPLEGPRASLLADGHAALDGRTYFELVEGGEGARWSLGRGPFGGAREDRIALEELETCEGVELTAAAGLLAFACTRPSDRDGDPNLSVELRVSRDRGATLTPVTTLATPSYAEVSLAAASDGTLLVFGACRVGAGGAKAAASAAPAAGARDAEPCNPKGPLFVQGGVVSGGGVANLEEGSARSPLLSLDGKIGYFLGRNKRDSQPTVFVSRDAGKSWQARVLEPPQASGWDDGNGEEMEPSRGSFYLPEGAALSLDEAGTIGVPCEENMGFCWATLDADGRVANVASPPEPASMIGGVGNRVLALGDSSSDGATHVWESLDGGSTWNEVAATPAVLKYGSRGGSLLGCALAGCLFGDELVRVGWEGQAEVAMPTPEENTAVAPDVALATPIACQLRAKSEWTRVAGRSEERQSGSGRGPGFPRLRELMRGKTAFSVLTIDDETGAVDIVSVPVVDADAPPATPLRKPLLPGEKGGRAAVTVRAQAEGYVALRAKVPTTKVGAVDTQKPLEGLELAWQNQFLSVTARKTVSIPGRFTAPFGSGPTLRPALLTVAMQGVVVQSSISEKATFVDSGGATPFEYPPLSARAADGRPITNVDATYLGGTPFGMSFVDRSPNAQVFLVARGRSDKDKGRAPAADELSSQTVGPALSEVDFLYAGSRVGVSSTWLPANDPSAAPARAMGFLLRDDGRLDPGFALPTMADISRETRFCSAEQRKSEPRSIAGHFGRFGLLMAGENRHPVVITDAGGGAGTSLTSLSAATDPQWLLSDGAVVFGKRGEACVGAYRASGVRAGWVAVIAGDLDHAWALRTVTAAPAKPGAKAPPRPAAAPVLEMRPMTCRFQPDLAVPYEVTSRAGQRLSDDVW